MKNTHFFKKVCLCKLPKNVIINVAMLFGPQIAISLYFLGLPRGELI